jgi:hypothetical protein
VTGAAPPVAEVDNIRDGPSAAPSAQLPNEVAGLQMSKVDKVGHPCSLREIVMAKQDVSGRLQERHEALWLSRLAAAMTLPGRFLLRIVTRLVHLVGLARDNRDLPHAVRQGSRMSPEHGLRLARPRPPVGSALPRL